MGNIQKGGGESRPAWQLHATAGLFFGKRANGSAAQRMDDNLISHATTLHTYLGHRLCKAMRALLLSHLWPAGPLPALSSSSLATGGC